MSGAQRYRPRSRRHTVARHGRLRTPRGPGLIAKVIAVALCVFVVSGVSVAAVATSHLAHAVHQIDLGDGTIPTIGAASGAVNLLIIGDDTRDGQTGHYGSNPGSALNDVNILIHISADHSKATVISIPRDTYLDVPACKSVTGAVVAAETDVKLNSVLTYGGVACIRDTVASLTGLTIPYVGLITFDGVVAMSDAVGGVPVCVASAINDDYTGLHLSAGEHTLKGAKALEFLRTRHGVGDGSDLTRISSQQVFLSSLVRKLKSTSTLTDITKLYSVADAATSHMTLSTSLANADSIVSVAEAVAPISLSKVVFVQYPTTVSGDGVVPNATLDSALMQAVKSDRAITLHKNTGEGSQGSVIKDGGGSSSTKSGTPSPSATPNSDSVELPSGVLGQTAAQQSCTVGNDLGTR